MDESTTTDEAGAFVLHVVPGAGTLKAIAENGDDASTKLTALNGQENRADLSLKEQGAVRGRVLDESGSPVPEAVVEMTAWQPGSLSRTSKSETITDGSFALRAASTATVQLTARKDGATGKASRKDETEIEIRLAKTGRLRVRTVGTDGEPFQLRRETRASLKDGKPLAIDQEASTGGELVVIGPPGEWVVTQRVIEPVRGPEQKKTVTVPVAPPETVVEMVLENAVNLRTLRGRVEDADGLPLAAAHVSLAWTLANDGEGGGRLQREGAARSDVTGRFSLSAGAGAQRLFVYHPEHRAQIVSVTMPPGADGDAGVIRLAKGRASTVLFESVGIGVQFEQLPAGPPKVRFVYEGTPAEKAGIKYGDVFLEVDGVSLAGMPMKDILPRTRGAEGTTARIRVQRDGGEPFVVDIARAKFLF
jgi:protocatechuate 3,4-dioxygenase beta subunit